MPRRKAGTLVPLEATILVAVAGLASAGVSTVYGYQLATEIAAAGKTRHLTAYGTLYRALARLEQMGLLSSEWEHPSKAASEHRPGRRLYTLTDAGSETARLYASVVDASSLRIPHVKGAPA